MRSKQVQILSGICGVQLIGYACRAAGFKTDIWIGFTGSVFLMLDIVYLAIQEKGRKKCPECDSEISKKVRISGMRLSFSAGTVRRTVDGIH